MARKGQFKKGGGRVGGGALVKYRAPARPKARRRKAARRAAPSAGRYSRPRSEHVDVISVSAPRRSSKRRSSGRRGGHHGVTFGKLLGTGIVLANTCEVNNGLLGDKIYNVVQKIPGAKTLGGAATAGLALGAIGKYTGIGGPRLRPWLLTAGVVGIVLSALKVGSAGTNFKWLGEADTEDPRMSFHG